MKKFMYLLISTRRLPVIGTISTALLKILFGIEIPKQVKLGRNVDFAHYATGLVLHESTVIEDDVKIYQGVTIGRGDIQNEFADSQMEGIIIRKGAIICAGAKVLCKAGVLEVGEGTIIGANAVLTRSTGDREVWAGLPARKVRDR